MQGWVLNFLRFNRMINKYVQIGHKNMSLYKYLLGLEYCILYVYSQTCGLHHSFIYILSVAHNHLLLQSKNRVLSKCVSWQVQFSVPPPSPDCQSMLSSVYCKNHAAQCLLKSLVWGKKIINGKVSFICIYELQNGVNCPKGCAK